MTDPTTAEASAVAARRRLPRARGRAQLLLVAAGVIAVALVPMALAYLQLGYDADVQAGGDLAAPEENAERLLSRAVHDTAVANGTSAADAAARTRENLAPWLDRLQASRLADGVAYQVSYNRTAATEWAAANCPGGPGRSFGPCETRDGVVVQDRAGDTHTVAVALDVTVVTRDGETRFTFVVRAVGTTGA
jgi:hypothetical protein